MENSRLIIDQKIIKIPHFIGALVYYIVRLIVIILCTEIAYFYITFKQIAEITGISYDTLAIIHLIICLILAKWYLRNAIYYFAGLYVIIIFVKMGVWSSNYEYAFYKYFSPETWDEVLKESMIIPAIFEEVVKRQGSLSITLFFWQFYYFYYYLLVIITTLFLNFCFLENFQYIAIWCILLLLFILCLIMFVIVLTLHFNIFFKFKTNNWIWLLINWLKKAKWWQIIIVVLLIFFLFTHINLVFS